MGLQVKNCCSPIAFGILLFLLCPGIQSEAQPNYFSIRENGSFFNGTECITGFTSVLPLISGSGYMISGDTWPEGNPKLLIQKIDGNGNILIQKAYGDSGTSYAIPQDAIIKTASGYLSAGFYVKNEFSKIHLTLFNEYGDTIYKKLYGDSIYQHAAACLDVNSDNEIIIGGRKLVDSVSTDIILLKLDSNANEIWRKYYNFSPVDGISKIECTADGGYLVSVTKWPAAYVQSLIFKTDSLGNIEWQKTLAFGNRTRLKASYVNLNNVFIYGHVRDTFSAKWRGYLALFDSTCQNLIWDKWIDGSGWVYFHDMVKNEDGTITLTGMKNQDFNFPLGWLTRINLNGDYLWERHFTEFSSSNYLFSLTKTPDNGYACAGYGWDTSGTTQGWILKVDSNGCESPVCVAPIEENLAETSTFKLYPNPSGGNFYFESNTFPCEISVYNIKGQLVLNKTLQQTETLLLSESGLYLISITDKNGNRETKKLVITD